MANDIIRRIDDALSCQAEGCDETLDDSPIDDFCSAGCQQRWHEARANLPAGYVGVDSGTTLQRGQLHRWGEDLAAPASSAELWAQDRDAVRRTAERLLRELERE